MGAARSLLQERSGGKGEAATRRLEILHLRFFEDLPPFFRAVALEGGLSEWKRRNRY